MPIVMGGMGTPLVTLWKPPSPNWKEQLRRSPSVRVSRGNTHTKIREAVTTKESSSLGDNPVNLRF